MKTRYPPGVRWQTQVTCTCGNTSPPAAPRTTARSTPTRARLATPSTPASSASWTPVVESLASRSGTARSSFRQRRPWDVNSLGRRRWRVAVTIARSEPDKVSLGVRKGAGDCSTSTRNWSASSPIRRFTLTWKGSQLGRRYAELGPIVSTYRQWHQPGRRHRCGATSWRLKTSRSPMRRDRAEREKDRRPNTCSELLIPRDPDDDRDVILEVKAGEGGDESALFAGDLLRMYLRYAERRGWKTEVLDAQESDLGGYKDASVAVKTKGVAGAWRRSLGAAEVRRWCAPRPAGSRHREPGAHPHQCRRCTWYCRRPRTSRSRSTPTTCGSTSIEAVVQAVKA